MIEPINLGPTTRDLYIKALRSGVESYMMEVSGYSLDRVRRERKLWLAGYNVFAEKVEPKAIVLHVHHRDNARPMRPLDREFCVSTRARMDALGMTGVQLARESGVSISMISDIRNEVRPVSPSSRRKIRAALSRAEGLSTAEGEAA